MKIQDQLTNLEDSKQLYELGVRYKEANFYWVSFTGKDESIFALCRPASGVEEMQREWAWFIIGEPPLELKLQLEDECINADGSVYPAFTTSELGIMLNNVQKDWLATIGHPFIGFHSCYIHEDKELSDSESLCSFIDESDPDFDNNKTEAQARGAMLIQLLETGKITAQEVNEKLKLYL